MVSVADLLQLDVVIAGVLGVLAVVFGQLRRHDVVQRTLHECRVQPNRQKLAGRDQSIALGHLMARSRERAEVS